MPAPSSALFHVECSPSTGRRIHASQDLPAGTPLLSTSALTTCVVLREYRREVCSFCFAYDSGRHWSVRNSEAGLAWCSEDCKTRWHEHWGEEVAVQAFTCVEKLVRKGSSKKSDDQNGNQDEVMQDAFAGPPTPEEVEAMWDDAVRQGELILAARTPNGGKSATKAARRAHQAALNRTADHTVLCHLLSGILLAYKHPDLMDAMLELYPAPHPYANLDQLQTNIAAYHQLLAILPPELLVHCKPSILRAVPSRDLPNSFGIRSLDDAGSEMFGYGVWPEASYWNHNCEPNIQKKRVGRAWEFWTSRDVKSGEELCITYLGGDEKVLDVAERRKRLQTTWGFTCACSKCDREARFL